MHDTIARLVRLQVDWHVIELIPSTVDSAVSPQTADLLICDHLSAYVPDIQTVLADWVAVLKPNGWLAVLDTVVPGSHLRGKKANLQRRAGDYVNGLLRLVDGANGRNLSLNEWLKILRVVNIRQPQYETNRHEIELNKWLDSNSRTPQTYSRLRAMLKQTPEPVTAALTPQWANDRITFFLTEMILVGRLGLND